MVGLFVAVDEMTIVFQGIHEEKRRITYKNEGDGFQCDALCDNSFCYQFYFYNYPAPKQYTGTGLSPLHSRVMSLFDSLEEDYHCCGMGNIYHSTTFYKRAYTHIRKVKVNGVARKGVRIIPTYVKQEEEKNRKKQINVRGVVKAVVLKGDPECPDLVDSSVYDTKSVHFLSMVCKEVSWVVKERLVYNVDICIKEIQVPKDGIH